MRDTPDIWRSKTPRDGIEGEWFKPAQGYIFECCRCSMMHRLYFRQSEGEDGCDMRVEKVTDGEAADILAKLGSTS